MSMQTSIRSLMLAAVAGVGICTLGAAALHAADASDMQGGADMQGASSMQDMAQAAPEPTPATQPAKPAALADDDAAPGGNRMRQRLTDALAELNLTQDQRTGIRAVLEQARVDGQAMRQELADASPQERAQRMREFARSIIEKISAQLTPDQVQTLKTAMAGQATSQPAALARGPKRAALRGESGGGQATPGARLQRLTQILNGLDLNEDQKAKVDAMMKDARQKAMAIPADAPDRVAQLQNIRQDIREKLTDILEPDQLETLRAKMLEQGNAPEPRRQARRDASTTQPAAMAVPQVHSQPSAAAEAPSPAAAPANGQLLATGEAAPPFKLESLDGSAVSLASLNGHVTALVFGSYSSPSFRQRAAGFESLYRKLQDQDSSVRLMVVYTREAHPAGGWEVERNKEDHISIPAAATDAARHATARQCRAALRLTIPFLLDTIDDATATAYGAFPDGAVVINKEGTVTATQRWAEPVTLGRQIEEAAGKKTTASLAP